MIETHIVQWLQSLTAESIRPLLLDENDALPALVYTPVAERNALGIDSSVESRFVQTQIDIWTETYKQAKTLEQEVRTLHGFAGDLFGISIGLAEISKNFEEIDSATRRYRISLDLKLYF